MKIKAELGNTERPRKAYAVTVDTEGFYVTVEADSYAEAEHKVRAMVEQFESDKTDYTFRIQE